VNGERISRFIGNVVFSQNETTIYCDSAHSERSSNLIEAFGHIRITEGDSVSVTSLGLIYNGNTKVAYLRKNVVFKKLGIATLYTDYLDYDRKKNEAKYFNGGKLVDSVNVLTSKKGYYNVSNNLGSFKTDVVGVNPDYTLYADTLQYNSKTKIIYFLDSTTIKDKKGGVAVYRSGFYNTNQKVSMLSKGEVETPTYKMQGEKYDIDDVKKFYRAKGKVVMISKEENLLIYGDDGTYDREKGIAKVFGNAYIAKVDDADTLFVRADTLVSIENADPTKKRLLAYNHVKIFKSDLQGTTDSLVYVNADSMLYFFKHPVLWSEENQMTADSIRILLSHKTIDRIYLVANSFVISQDSLTNFNQIKGRKMTAFMKNKVMDHVIVEGNGESIYFVLQEPKTKSDSLATKATMMMGMNHIICSNMKINFKEGKVNNISFYVKPDASVIPPHELKPEDRKMKGFVWYSKDRPDKMDVIGRKGEKAKLPQR
jgi:lipopolysaccharide export system protein LptA